MPTTEEDLYLTGAFISAACSEHANEYTERVMAAHERLRSRLTAGVGVNSVTVAVKLLDDAWAVAVLDAWAEKHAGSWTIGRSFGRNRVLTWAACENHIYSGDTYAGARLAAARALYAEDQSLAPSAEPVAADAQATYEAWVSRPRIDWELCTCPKTGRDAPTKPGSAIVVGHRGFCPYIAARCDRDAALIAAHKAAGGGVDWAGEPVAPKPSPHPVVTSSPSEHLLRFHGSWTDLATDVAALMVERGATLADVATFLGKLRSLTAKNPDIKSWSDAIGHRPKGPSHE